MLRESMLKKNFLLILFCGGLFADCANFRSERETLAKQLEPQTLNFYRIFQKELENGFDRGAYNKDIKKSKILFNQATLLKIAFKMTPTSDKETNKLREKILFLFKAESNCLEGQGQ